MGAAVRYTLSLYRPEAHLFRVTAECRAPVREGQRFWLPVWLPGSYLVREFARHIVSLRAYCGAREVLVRKVDTHTWQCGALPKDEPLRVEYEVYGKDASVRGAWLDTDGAFFNGSSLFLAFAGREAEPCTLDLAPLPKGWRAREVLTTLPERGKKPLRWRAPDYETLIDHPFVIADVTRLAFRAGGVPHELAIRGRHDCDGERLTADLARICAWQQNLFGMPAPFARYLFLVHATGHDYGGLEHRDCTALVTPRNDLPWPGMTGTPEGYVRFLGLCSHEYFHAWHVKRIRPAAFSPPDLHRENFTRLLWVFEGFTSYYDDLALLRAGVIDETTWRALFAKNLATILQTPGRLRQSVAEASFDAWIKYYRQDENAPNALVSYYTKGALIAAALDLRLRAESKGRVSLDDLMRRLWREHGQTGRGLEEDEIYAHLVAVGDVAAPGQGAALARWLRTVVEGTRDLDFNRLLAPFGLRLHWKTDASAAAPELGARLSAAKGQGVRLVQVYTDGAAQRAGLSAEDLLIACNGLRLENPAALHAALARARAGDVLTLHYFRRDELRHTALTVPDAAPRALEILPLEKPTAAQRKLRAGWLQRAAG